MKFIVDTRLYEDAATALIDVVHLHDLEHCDSDLESDCYSDDSSLDIRDFDYRYDDDDEVVSESVASYINALFPSVDYRHGGNDDAERILQFRLEALIEQLSRDDGRTSETSRVIDDDDSLVLTRRLRSSSRRKEKTRSSSLGDSLHLSRCTVPTVAHEDDAVSWEAGAIDDDDDDFSEYFIALKDHSQSSASQIARTTTLSSGRD
jgi:hypothetical protein